MSGKRLSALNSCGGELIVFELTKIWKLNVRNPFGKDHIGLPVHLPREIGVLLEEPVFTEGSRLSD